jgi:hypothetical protein
MSIIDKICEFSDGQDLAALSTSSVISDDVVDLGDTDLYMGVGCPVYLIVKIGTAASGGTSLQFRLYEHTTTTVNSGTCVWDSGAIGVGTLVAGYEMAVALPARLGDNGQYIGMYYTAVGDVTACTVDAYLTLAQDGFGAYGAQETSSNIT